MMVMAPGVAADITVVGSLTVNPVWPSSAQRSEHCFQRPDAGVTPVR
jgi:hypothetical protein